MESGSPIAAFIVGALAVPSALALLVAPLSSAARQRGGLALIGALLIALGVSRPRIWWEHPSVEGARALFGDAAYVLFHVALGAAFIFGAWWASGG